MFPSLHCRCRPAVLALTLAAALALPSRASAAGTTRLGNPRMHTLTGKIPPPYSEAFNLRTEVSAWPTLVDAVFKSENEKDSTGLIYVKKVFNTSATQKNQGAAMANDAGTFLSWAEMTDPFPTLNDHVGVFSFTQWSQSFRKDSLDAFCHFTISGANLHTMCFTTGCRAEFAFDVSGYYGGTEFYFDYQQAGLKMIGHPPNLPSVEYTVGGPMTYTASNPDGIHRDYQLLFNPLTIGIDLSGIPVGGEFSIVYKEMTQANIKFDELVRAFAYFRDPLDDSAGVAIEVSGVTPTDNPQIPTPVAVGDAAPSPRLATLSAPRPNPSNGAVAFQLGLPSPGNLRVGVFDLGGRRVAEIANRSFAAGTHALSWDGRRDDGSMTPAGIYFVRAVGPQVDVTQRVVRITSR